MVWRGYDERGFCYSRYTHTHTAEEKKRHERERELHERNERFHNDRLFIMHFLSSSSSSSLSLSHRITHQKSPSNDIIGGDFHF